MPFRLTSFTPGAGAVAGINPQQFTYDAIGNRMSLKAAPAATAGSAANTQTYTYPGTSHRLQITTGNVTKQFTHDATGNTLTETGAGVINGSLTFTFDHKTGCVPYK